MIVLAVAAGLYLRGQNDPPEKRGSATEEFVTTEEPEPKPPPKKENKRPWPTYGYDNARQHISPYTTGRLTSASGRSTHTTRSSSRRRSGTGASTSHSRRASSSRSTRRPASRTGSGAMAAAPPPRRRSGRASSTSRTCTRWSASRASRARTASSRPGTRTTGMSAGATGPQPVESSPLLHGKRLFFGLLGPRRARGQREYGQAHLALRGRQRDEHVRGMVEAPDLHRVRQRHALLARREVRQAALERALRLGRVLVRHPDGRLRARLHRQHRRHDVRVRREERQAALGAPARQLHLRRGRGLPPQGLRGHLRRQVLRARCRHRRRDLAEGRRRHGARRADRHGRPRLLRDLLHLRVGGAARRGRRDGLHLRRCDARDGKPVGTSTAASTRTRWSPTTSASTSPAGRTSSPSRRRARRPSRSTWG